MKIRSSALDEPRYSLQQLLRCIPGRQKAFVRYLTSSGCVALSADQHPGRGKRPKYSARDCIIVALISEVSHLVGSPPKAAKMLDGKIDGAINAYLRGSNRRKSGAPYLLSIGDETSICEVFIQPGRIISFVFATLAGPPA